MQYLWNITVDDLEDFYNICAEVKKEINRELTPEEREIIFQYLMKNKGIKPCGTELTKTELWEQLTKDGKTILNIDNDGYKIIKRKED